MCFSVDQRTYNQFKIYDETWLLPRYSMPIFPSVVFLHHKISSSSPILEFCSRIIPTLNSCKYGCLGMWVCVYMWSIWNDNYSEWQLFGMTRLGCCHFSLYSIPAPQNQQLKPCFGALWCREINSGSAVQRDIRQWGNLFTASFRQTTWFCSFCSGSDHLG